ncbi:restriction endonuclease subunit S [Obesumbacterium proteus]|uniref:restriction endonuclease subunit S n=1 Tax=Obesumbacterium proteus TaxID=82983 RepID=UPI0010335C41|nr:restriction endonuclease subunit S [Obesumbacterium proteus]TBL77978.1 restriction endonuclease subunit S [Obesumbacterium proteus]
MENKFGSRLLGELCHEITVGFVGPMTNEYIDNGIPFLRSKNIDEYDVKWDDMKYISLEFHKKLSKSALKPGDVAIVRTGKPGTTCVIPNNLEEANCSDIIIVRVNNELLCPHYLSYFMNAMAHGQVNAHVVGAVQQHFNVGSAKKLEIPLPIRAIQANIVHVLKTLDDKVKLNRQINQTLEQMAQALFKSWFVDYDPVVDNALDAGFFERDLEFSDELLRRAESRKAVRESADFKPLPEKIRQLFPAAFEKCSEPSLGLGGWVPEGWLETKLSELVDTVSKTYPLKTVDEVIFLNTGDIENGNFLHANFSKVDGLPGQAKKSIRKGDILYSEIRPKNKRFAYVGFESNNYVVSTKLMVLRAKDGFHPFFAYFLLTLNQTIDELQRIAELRSGTFPQITFNELSLIKFILPSTGGVMERFVSLYLEPFFEKSSSNRQENELLVNLRETLLPKLISGEIQFNENEAEIANEVLV